MSGGTWGYQQFRIEEEAGRFVVFMKAIAESEGLLDWAEACDTTRADAEPKLYDIWLKVFNEVYG